MLQRNLVVDSTHCTSTLGAVRSYIMRMSVSYNARRDEITAPVAFDHPTDRGFHGIVPPQAKPAHPMVTGATF